MPAPIVQLWAILAVVPRVILLSTIASFFTAAYAAIVAVQADGTLSLIVAIVVNIGPMVGLIIGTITTLAKISDKEKQRQHESHENEMARRERMHDFRGQLQLEMLKREEALMELVSQKAKTVELEVKLGQYVSEMAQLKQTSLENRTRIHVVEDHIDSGTYPAVVDDPETVAAAIAVGELTRRYGAVKIATGEYLQLIAAPFTCAWVNVPVYPFRNKAHARETLMMCEPADTNMESYEIVKKPDDAKTTG